MESLTSQIIIAFVFGVVFVTAMLLIAIKFPNLTPSQDRVFRIILSISVAGVAAMIPGFISLEINPNVGSFLRAGGAIAVFVLVYFYNPAKLVSDSTEEYMHKDQAAAICFRKSEGKIEFLLVRTTGGRWTFPKGKVENNEEMWFSAKREAFEEAGALGSVEHTPLTTYLHEKKEWKNKGREITIHAFLLNVENTQNPQEENRDPTWFVVTDAEKALVEDRGFKYSEEFRRVLELANKHIANLA